jgi:DNA mismatch repair ATPase MutS
MDMWTLFLAFWIFCRLFFLAERHDAATCIISCMQVGLAAFDLRTARLHLSQYIETSRSYQNTVTLLEYFDPSDIVIPSNSVLARSGMTGVDSIVANFTTATKVRIMLYTPFV